MKRKWSAASLLLLAFALRMVALDGPALRGDEAHTVIGWAKPLPAVLEERMIADPHPPLAYLAFHLWLNAAGTTELAARYLSVLAGLVAAAGVYRLGEHIRARAGAIAALLWAVNPFQVWHAQDARNYALWVAASVLSVWLMLRAVRRDRRRDWLLYIAAAVVAAYVYYLELFLLVFQNVYVLAAHRRDRARLRRWLLAQFVVALCLAPWYLQPQLWAGGYTGTAGRLELPRLFSWVAPTLVYGETLPAGWLDGLWVLLWVLLGAGLVRLGRGRRFLFVAAYAAVPLILLSVLSATRPIFRPRYILASAPAYTLALAVLVVGLRSRRLRAGVLAALLLVDGAALVHHYADPAFRKSPDWRGLAAFLEARAGPDDLVIQNNAPDPALEYYYGGAYTTIPAHPDEAPPATAARLAEALETHRALWLLVGGNPNWDAGDTALHWLEANAQRLGDDWVGRFRVQQWRAWEVKAGEPEESVRVRVGDFARLVGYDVYALNAGALTVVLYWAPLAAAPRDYAVFVHVGSPPLAQADHLPRVPTSAWRAGRVLRDVFQVDAAGVPPGTYPVWVGLYDPATAARVALDAPGLEVREDAVALFDVGPD